MATLGLIRDVTWHVLGGGDFQHDPTLTLTGARDFTSESDNFKEKDQTTTVSTGTYMTVAVDEPSSVVA